MAYLTAASERFDFKHQLEKLILPACLKVDPAFEFIRDLVRIVDAYSVDIRYPGESANREEALKAVSAMKQIRDFIRAKLRIAKPRAKKRR